MDENNDSVNKSWIVFRNAIVAKLTSIFRRRRFSLIIMGRPTSNKTRENDDKRIVPSSPY